MAGKKAQESSEELLAKINDAEVSDASEEISDDQLFEGEETQEQTEEQEETTEEAEETSEEEETEAAEERVESQPKTYKIIVDGKEEIVTEEKLVEYAQKGRFLEKERAKDNAEKREIDWEAEEKKFLENVKKEGFLKSSMGMVATAIKFDREQQKDRRKQARNVADGSEWGKDSSYRERFFDLIEEGKDPDIAGTEMSADYWQNQAKSAQAKGAKKQKAKQAAEIKEGKESVEDERESEGEAPTVENFVKMASNPKTSSEELLKVMKKAGVPIGRDTV